MKKILYTLTALLSFAIFQACNKSMEGATKQIAIDASIAQGAVYQLNLSPYGNVASILKQASIYTTSNITTISGSTEKIYSYSASTKTGLTDEVVLAITNEKAGRRDDCRKAVDSTVITIKFNIK